MTHYEVLGVTTSATAEQIKVAYKRLAKRTHPDLGGSTDQFARVHSAYEVLSDTLRRRSYDRSLAASRGLISWDELARRVRESEQWSRPKEKPKETWDDIIRQMFGYTPSDQKDVWDRVIDFIIRINQPFARLGEIFGNPPRDERV